MSQLRKNELAALGLVNRVPMHGYGLAQAIQHMGLEHWTTVSRSSIYAALRRLAREGAVSISHEREGGAPERTIYHITPVGREMLHEILREALAYVGPEDRYFYLGVAFGDALPAWEVTRLIEARLTRLQRDVAEEKQDCTRLAEAAPRPNQFTIMSRGGVRHFEVEIDICAELIDLYRHREDQSSDGDSGRQGGGNG
ncbi:MAG: PadR family transcriptional regulator [Candidatus Eisenbacteria bacterium]|jgi:DNA-binding PadR family transcriptional regulator|nr:PadR family transcriptional regulator [Candidatus Eisenbacteria bacterium]